jgi:hypothetical protein
MRISIPFDLSSRPFIPLLHFIHSGRPTPLFVPSFVFSPLCSVQSDMMGAYLRVLPFFFVLVMVLVSHCFSFPLVFVFFYSVGNKL